MLNVVSYKIASVMYDRGFPQPEPQPGQFWWAYDNCEPFLVCAIAPVSRFQKRFFLVGISPDTGEKWFLNRAIFAPSADYMLSLLPDNVFLSWSIDGMFQARIMSENFERAIYEVIGSNAADCLGREWLNRIYYEDGGGYTLFTV